ncbi:hypothetical protein J4214_04300 [Candidatus Woesearchaeota archaeon]|nr:hypothetical protein [Candidatus Woesearchaeota archaeon]
MEINAIVTMPPYAPYLDRVLEHKIVSGIRLNTVMPLKGTLEDTLRNLNEKAKKYKKELWIDLKCRQLRTKNYATPPFTEIELTHRINVNTPCKAYFSDRKESATILEVDNNRLIMLEGPGRVVGPGESVTIIDPSLIIEEHFTEKDIEYIEAMNKISLHNYMLSFFESQQDASDLYNLDPNADIIAKIESKKGLEYIYNNYDKNIRLMAARGDLFLGLKMPHHILKSVEDILRKDPNAIAASRIFSSLNKYNLEPTCEEINDVDNLLRMGYRTLMFGDDICMNRDSIISGLNLLYAITEGYRK